MTIKKFTLLASAAILFGMTSSVMAAPGLKLGSATGAAGSTVQLPLTFKPGDASVSALQFNLILPKGLTADIATPSSLLTQAGKMVTNTHRDTNWTFIIYGPNKTAIGAGELLTVGLRVAPGTPAGSLKVGLANAVFSDPDARSLKPGSLSGGAVKVTSGTPTK